MRQTFYGAYIKPVVGSVDKGLTHIYRAAVARPMWNRVADNMQQRERLISSSSLPQERKSELLAPLPTRISAMPGTLDEPETVNIKAGVDYHSTMRSWDVLCVASLSGFFVGIGLSEQGLFGEVFAAALGLGVAVNWALAYGYLMYSDHKLAELEEEVKAPQALAYEPDVAVGEITAEDGQMVTIELT